MTIAKKLFSLAGCIFSFGLTNAQHSIVYSQYMFNGLLINPAYAGSHIELSASLSHRNQWVNFPGAPQTTTLGVHSSFNKERIGMGLLLTNDNIGSYGNTGLFGSYAYRIRKPNGGVLSLGVQAGFNSFLADFSDLNLSSPNDPIFGQFLREFRPNFGGGVFYYNNKFFVGFSIPTILKGTSFSSETLQSLVTPRYYLLHAGMIWSADRIGNFKINPSFLLRMQDGTPASADLNLNLVFYDLISLGTSYRTGDAIVTFINFKLSEKFRFAYSYDWTLSDIHSYSKGSHEFMLTYRTRIQGVHKDIECPYYFNH